MFFLTWLNKLGIVEVDFIMIFDFRQFRKFQARTRNQSWQIFMVTHNGVAVTTFLMSGSLLILQENERHFRLSNDYPET